MKVSEVKVEVAGDKFSYQIRTGYTYNRAVLKIYLYQGSLQEQCLSLLRGLEKVA